MLLNIRQIGNVSILLRRSQSLSISQSDRKNKNSCLRIINKMITVFPKFKLYETQRQIEQRYGIYGPNNAIYLGFLNRLFMLMFFSSVFIVVPLLAINLSGSSCDSQQYCSQKSYLYYMSLFNSVNQKQKNLAQVIIWLICSIMVCLYFIYLRIYGTETYKRINNKNITQAGYSIIIRRIPLNATVQQIKQLFKKQILHQIVINQQLSYAEVSKLLQIQDIVLLYNMKQTVQLFDKQVKLFKKLISKGQYQHYTSNRIPEPVEFAGTAIIIFKSTRAPYLIHNILKRKLKDQLIQYFLPFMAPRTQFKVQKQYVSIYRAPQPSDILWNNLGYQEKYRVAMKIIFTILTILILALSTVLSYLIGLFSQKYSDRGRNIQISILASIIVFFFNMLISKLLISSTKNQKLDTKTNLQTERLRLMVFHQSINLGFFSVVVPLIVQYPNLLNGLIQADLPTVLTTMLAFKTFFNLTLDFILQYFNITAKIYRCLIHLKIVTKTQCEANVLFKGIQIHPQQKCASIIQLVWFGFIFGIVSPLCILISAIGLGLLYPYQRCLFNSKYCIPSYGKNRFNTQFMNIISFIPLLIGLSNLFIYNIFFSIHNQYQQISNIFAVIIANIVLGGANVLIPWQQILQQFNYNTSPNSEDLYDYRKFQLTYKQANPAYSNKADILFNEKLLHMRKRAFIDNKNKKQKFYNQLNPKIQTCRNLNQNI